MANDYLSVAEVKAVLADEAWGTAYDAILTTSIKNASRAVDLFTGRQPGAYSVSDTSTRYFDGKGKTAILIQELAALPTSVAVAEGGVIDGAGGTGGTYTAWSTQDYLMLPYNALDIVNPFTEIEADVLNGSKTGFYNYRKNVKIVGKWGYATTASLVPEVKQATTIQAIRYFQRGKQAYRDVGAISALGQLQYVQPLDPDIGVILTSLARQGI